MIRMRLLVASLAVIGLGWALGGCSKPAANESPVWANPAPISPDTSAMTRGDKTKAPKIHRVGVAHYDLKNGWYVVPRRTFRMAAEVEGATDVRFMGWVPDADQQMDPDSNSYLKGSKVAYATSSSANITRWEAEFGSYGGLTRAVFVVAENDYGRVVSPVLYIAWVPEEGEYTQAKLREPLDP